MHKEISIIREYDADFYVPLSDTIPGLKNKAKKTDILTDVSLFFMAYWFAEANRYESVLPNKP